MDFTSNRLHITLKPKFACAHTKAEAIILNVLRCDLEKAIYIYLLTDSGNRRVIKNFLMLVKYFYNGTGMKIKVFELKSLPGETSVMIFACLPNRKWFSRKTC
jgi:hypothetical protein